MKRLTFILFVALLATAPRTFSQRAQNSDLATFLKSKGYMPITLTKLPTGHLCLKGQVNDSTATFILDTGAGATVIDACNEQRFGLQSSQTSNTATGAGGNNIALKNSVAKSLVLQGCYLSNFKLHIMSLDHVNNALKKLGIPAVDGVIGADVLSQRKAIIDYTNLVLYLTE